MKMHDFGGGGGVGVEGTGWHAQVGLVGAENTIFCQWDGRGVGRQRNFNGPTNAAPKIWMAFGPTF